MIRTEGCPSALRPYCVLLCVCVCVYETLASILSVFLVVLEKVPSCDQERQSALDEARQNPREAIFIPDCEAAGLYKAVQCHQSTGYCWCVLVDTGRPIPGTSTRYRPPPSPLRHVTWVLRNTEDEVSGLQFIPWVSAN